MAGRLPIAVVGAGGFGREVAWLIEDVNQERPRYEFIGFIDDMANSTPEGYPVLATIEHWMESGRQDVQLACAIGDSMARYKVTRRLLERGHRFATLIHPTVQRSRWVEVGQGSIVCAGTILTTRIAVGEYSLLNLDCTVGHDSQLGSYTSMMPGVHISGDVVLEKGTYFGTGAVIINRVRVGAWTVIGAGATVTSDLPSGVVAVGVPAKPIKQLENLPE